MKDFLRAAEAKAGKFLRGKTRRRALCLCLLGVAAFSEFLVLGLARRTFVFYSIDTRAMVVEDRMVSKTGSRERDVRRYVEEALLGPVSLDSAPLFPKGTRLESLLFRDGVAYADLSESAALPVLEGVDAFTGLHALYGGIKRNFPYVRDVRLFIAGREAYPEKFRENIAGIDDILREER
jgi:hypothetical protein